MQSRRLFLLLLLCGCAHRRVWTEPFSGMELVLVPRGSFTMGSPANEPGRRDDEPQHRVTIDKPFYLGATEVTQRQWETVMGYNPSTFPNPDAPVEQVTYWDILTFLGRLNARGGARFRLPTEAEWEYACRAGTTTAFATSPGNVDGKSTMRVKSFAPNAWGLYDMHGNVWEWTSSDYAPTIKVIRGGSFYFGADSARSASRYTHEPHHRGFSIGFRVVREQ